MAQRDFLETFGHRPGIILADINPLYLNALLPDPFVAAPLLGEEYQAQALALAKRGLGQSRPVYALFVSRKGMEEKAARLPQIDGYEWVPAENLPAETLVLKLSPK